MDYLRVLARNRRLMFLVMAAALLGAFAYGVLSTPMYQGKVTIHVQANAPVYVPSIKDVESRADAETFYSTQLDIIRSRAVAEAVVKKLDERERAALLTPSLSERLLGAVGRLRQTILGDSPSAARESQAGAGETPSTRRVVTTVKQNLQVFRRKDSELLELSYDAPSAELAAHVANLAAEAYRSTQENQRLQVSERVQNWLSSQLGDLRSELEQSEKAVQEYKKKHGLLDSGDLNELKGKKLSTVSQDLLDARAKRIRAESRYKQVQNADDADAVVAVLDNPVVQQLRMQQAKLQAELDQLSTRYGERAPKVQSVRAELQSTTSKLRSEIARAKASLRKSYREAKATEKRLEQSQADVNEGVRSQSDETLELAKLEREAETNRQLYQAFRNRMKETRLAGTMGAPGIRVIDAARPSGSPFSPNFPRLLGIAGLLSFFIAVGLAFLRENLRRTVHTPQAAEQRFHFRSLGVVPRVSLRRPATLPRLASLDPGCEFTEAVGAIRTRLQIAGGEGGPQVMLVTSALPSEGKSTLSSNLASSYSQLERTLLIDADLRRGSVSSEWKSAGLSDFVLGRAQLNACVGQDNVSPNLFVMGKGQATANPLDFFAAPELASALAELRRHFQRIVIDTAPVLSVSDVELMGRFTDGAVVAVRAGRSPTEAVTETLRRLYQAGVPVLGLALTQVDMKEISHYGGYSYGYGAS
jgi:capsular exopolysaccharide synthesis family protein